MFPFIKKNIFILLFSAWNQLYSQNTPFGNDQSCQAPLALGCPALRSRRGTTGIMRGRRRGNELRVTVYDPLRGVPVAELEVRESKLRHG